MKLRYYTDNVLNELRSEIKENLEHYCSPKECEWVSKYEFRESKFEIALSESQTNFLKIDPGYEHDCENSIALFNHLRELTVKQASSECFWCCMCHTIPAFYEYASTRWFSKGVNDSSVQTHFFAPIRSNLPTQNALARLWWGAFVSYDDSHSSDQYALTRVLWKYQTRFKDFMDTLNSHSRIRALGILEALKIRDENEGLYLVANDGKTDSDFRSLNRYLNRYSLVAPLDFLGKEQIRDLALAFFKKRKERIIKSS